jgi:hypothetical protein
MGGVKMTKFLTDEGSGINILYKDAFEKINIEARKLHPRTTGYAPRHDHSVCHGDQVHYCKETLSFEVIDFEGPYHAILKRPSYTKFMAIPSYAYLKLKISGPRGVITIAGSFQYAYECKRLAVEQAQRDLILDEPKHAYKDKQEASSRMTQCSPQSPEHRLTPETPTSILPPDSTVSASLATPMPPEAPDLCKEAKLEEEKDDLAIRRTP